MLRFDGIAGDVILRLGSTDSRFAKLDSTEIRRILEHELRLMYKRALIDAVAAVEEGITREGGPSGKDVALKQAAIRVAKLGTNV